MTKIKKQGHIVHKQCNNLKRCERTKIDILHGFMISSGLYCKNIVLYVQEVVTNSYSKLLYQLGYYFLDTQYAIYYLVC